MCKLMNKFDQLVKTNQTDYTIKDVVSVYYINGELSGRVHLSSGKKKAVYNNTYKMWVIQ